MMHTGRCRLFRALDGAGSCLLVVGGGYSCLWGGGWHDVFDPRAAGWGRGHGAGMEHHPAGGFSLPPFALLLLSAFPSPPPPFSPLQSFRFISQPHQSSLCGTRNVSAFSQHWGRTKSGIPGSLQPPGAGGKEGGGSELRVLQGGGHWGAAAAARLRRIPTALCRPLPLRGFSSE